MRFQDHAHMVVRRKGKRNPLPGRECNEESSRKGGYRREKKRNIMTLYTGK